MGKKSTAKPGTGRGSEQAGLVAVDPAAVRFTHSRIRPQFSCGRRVEGTLEDLASGKTTVVDLPPITLISASGGDEGPFFSLNNRRLYVLKQLRHRGLITTVDARIKPAADSKRERERYTVEKCSLTARLMGGKSKGADEDEAGSRSTDDEEEEGGEEGKRRAGAAHPPKKGGQAVKDKSSNKRGKKKKARDTESLDDDECSDNTEDHDNRGQSPAQTVKDKSSNTRGKKKKAKGTESLDDDECSDNTQDHENRGQTPAQTVKDKSSNTRGKKKKAKGTESLDDDEGSDNTEVHGNRGQSSAQTAKDKSTRRGEKKKKKANATEAREPDACSEATEELGAQSPNPPAAGGSSGDKPERPGAAGGQARGKRTDDEAAPAAPAVFPAKWKVTLGDVTVRAVDANTLGPGQWVLDPVLTVYLEDVARKATENGRRTVVLHPPVARLLKQMTPQDAACVVEDQSLDAADVVLVPVNDSSASEAGVSGSHWSLLVFSRERDLWLHYDSSAAANRRHAEQLALVLDPWVDADCEVFGFEEAECEQQANGYDCGVHVMINAARLVGVPEPDEPSALRKRLRAFLWTESVKRR
ncbi:NEDD8-specific protease 1 [Diplonema papillatum]|nr:NEDD8-specific protease 1 [Diplonema papillatum]